MAATNAPTSESIESAFSGSCTMGDSMAPPEFRTALACESGHATPSSAPFFSARCESLVLGSTESGHRTPISEPEELIEFSKVHWSQLSKQHSGGDDEEEAEVGMRWYDEGFDYYSAGELEVGEKFAEGAQAELFLANVTWRDAKMNECDQEDGTGFTLKVFKSGTLLKDLHTQWSHGMLQLDAEDVKRTKLGKPQPARYQCGIQCAPTSESIESAFSDSCTMGDSMAPPEFRTALACESAGHATPSSAPFFSARCESLVVGSTEFGQRTSISEPEERIERSKVHWSQLAKPHSSGDDEEVAEVGMSEEEEEAVNATNLEVFKALQSHSTWGDFFKIFGDAEGFYYCSAGELEVGEKFAEGAQAELFHANVIWRDPKRNEEDQEDGTEWALKVFKKGTLLQDLQPQWPHGMLQFHVQNVKRTKLEKPAPIRFQCDIHCASLLRDGRFAFLMVKEDEDLRSVIARSMSTNNGKSHGPFQKHSEETEIIMYQIALGMEWLHSHDIVHRDLKASNVLMDKDKNDGTWLCFVADYECSIGVAGTGFWRAPEILQACKERNVSKRPELFTEQADVYSYGMTCYEVLTGELPFKGHLFNDYDLVLNGNRSEVPEYVDAWAHELLKRCWQSNPLDRPSFGDILSLLEANSATVRDAKLRWERWALEDEQLWLAKRENLESVGDGAQLS